MHAAVHPYVRINLSRTLVRFFFYILFQSHNTVAVFYWQLTNRHARFVASEINEFNGMFYRRIVPRFVVFSTRSRFPAKIFPRDPLSALCISNVVFVVHLFWRDHSVRRGIPFRFTMKMTESFSLPDAMNLLYLLLISFDFKNFQKNFLSLTETKRTDDKNEGTNDDGSRKRVTLIVVTSGRLIITTFNDWNANWPLDKLVGPLQFIGTDCGYYSVDH